MGRSHSLAICAALLFGCQVDSLRLSSERDASLNPDGFVIPDAPMVPDAGPDAQEPDACLPKPEDCNGMDDDCDGVIDNGFVLESDPENCGECGIICNRPGTQNICVDGECAFPCVTSCYDLNGDAIKPKGEESDGCEYCNAFCTLGAEEVCNDQDDDCDAEVDEGFELGGDVENCGACGNACPHLQGDPTCFESQCTYPPIDCDAGFANLDLDDEPTDILGCEYECPDWPPGDESCDNQDNDCDGVRDEGLGPPIGDACGSDTGECVSGTLTCFFGNPICGAPYVGPVAEICDDLDTDCDDVPDCDLLGPDEFGCASNKSYCGGCATRCDDVLVNAVSVCVAGQCEVDSCIFGWHDWDGDDEPGDTLGCEAFCVPSGPELCNGCDDDCDQLIDNADDPGMPGGMLPVANICDGDGACAGTSPICPVGACGDVDWVCEYPATVDTNTDGTIRSEEIRCDGIDNDCDLLVDEPWPLRGTACDDGELGQCRGVGSYVCDPSDVFAGLVCDIPSGSEGAEPVVETCNGLDEDCDGEPDDGAPNDMVFVDGPGALDFWIDVFEASRPDASTLDEGVMDHRSCSQPCVLPWSNVTFAEATAACVASGKRLCTESEWEEACEGPLDNVYPYGDVYAPGQCNGGDYDPDCSGADGDWALTTGVRYGCPPTTCTAECSPTVESCCVSDWDVYDLSGNLQEWTGTLVTSGSPSSYRVRGGSFDDSSFALTCQEDFLSLQEDFVFPNLGFRCCCDAGDPDCP